MLRWGPGRLLMPRLHGPRESSSSSISALPCAAALWMGRSQRSFRATVHCALAPEVVCACTSRGQPGATTMRVSRRAGTGSRSRARPRAGLEISAPAPATHVDRSHGLLTVTFPTTGRREGSRASRWRSLTSRHLPARIRKVASTGSHALMWRSLVWTSFVSRCAENSSMMVATQIQRSQRTHLARAKCEPREAGR